MTNTKTTIALILMIVALLGGITGCIQAIGKTNETSHLSYTDFEIYSREGVIENIDYENAITTIKDTNGNLWEIYGGEALKVGEPCRIWLKLFSDAEDFTSAILYRVDRLD